MIILVDIIDEPEAAGDISITIRDITQDITLEQARELASELEIAIQEADRVKVTLSTSSPSYSYMAGKEIK